MQGCGYAAPVLQPDIGSLTGFRGGRKLQRHGRLKTGLGRDYVIAS